MSEEVFHLRRSRQAETELVKLCRCDRAPVREWSLTPRKKWRHQWEKGRREIRGDMLRKNNLRWDDYSDHRPRFPLLCGGGVPDCTPSTWTKSAWQQSRLWERLHVTVISSQWDRPSSVCTWKFTDVEFSIQRIDVSKAPQGRWRDHVE